MILLKQSTAATLRVGPFMDATNGVTPETGITLGAADQAEILKASGATVDIAAATWAAITGAGGWYDLSLTTSHTDTLGMLTVIVQDESVCLPVFVRAMVIPANAYDGLVSGSGVGVRADVQGFGGTALTAAAGIPEVKVASLAANSITATAIAADAITAAKVADDVSTEIRDKLIVRTTVRGAAATGTLSPTQCTTSGMSPAMSAADQLKGRIIIFDHDTTTAELRGQASDITASSAASNPLLTFSALTTAPANGDSFTIV